MRGFKATSEQLIGLESGWLGREPEAFRSRFTQLCRFRALSAGQPVYAVDDHADILVGVAVGQLALLTPLVSGEEAIAHICSAGFWLGASMLASHTQRRHIAAVARTDAVVAVIPLTVMRRSLRDAPEWWPSMARLMEANWTHTACLARDLMLRRHSDRIAATLLRLVGLRPSPANPVPELRISVTHQEVAVMSNCSQSFVHAELRRFQDQGWVELAYGRIQVLAPQAMLASLVP